MPITGVVGLYRGTRQLTHPDYKIIGVDDDAEDAESAVLEASRSLVMDLHAGCRGLTVLATSREALGLESERSYDVPPLPERAPYTLEQGLGDWLPGPDKG